MASDQSSVAARKIQSQEPAKRWAQVLSQAWTDESFKKRLVASPVQTLAECGIHAPEGVDIRVVENTDKLMYLTLPAKSSGQLTAAQLESVVGGGTATTTKTTTTTTSGGDTPVETVKLNYGTIEWSY